MSPNEMKSVMCERRPSFLFGGGWTVESVDRDETMWRYMRTMRKMKKVESHNATAQNTRIAHTRKERTQTTQRNLRASISSDQQFSITTCYTTATDDAGGRVGRSAKQPPPPISVCGVRISLRVCGLLCGTQSATYVFVYVCIIMLWVYNML